jgi:biotin-dependent carboxylase-like uncharacterized protein
MSALIVRAVGPQALVEDAGRPGWLALGVSGSGAMDASAAALANRLVGNAGNAAVIEALLGGLEVEAADGVWCAVTGTDAPVRLDRTMVAANTPIHVPAGSRLAIGAPTRGMRAYLAVRGGIAVPPVLGSRSTDTLARLGPAPLAVGDVLPIAAATGSWAPVDHAPVGPAPAEGEVLRIAIRPGPREARLRSMDDLLDRTWTVGTRQDRVGVRLEGEPLVLADDGALPSEGTIAGAVEVPSGGLPYVLMRDHPVTVGYPVVAVVEPAGLTLLAQARPGCLVRFAISR